MLIMNMLKYMKSVCIIYMVISEYLQQQAAGTNH